MELEILLTSIGLIIALFGPIVFRKIFKRPRLDVEIMFTSGSSRNLGPSANNVFETLNDGSQAVNSETALYIISINREYNINIYNNSEVSAHYLKLYYPAGSLIFDKVDKLGIDPLPPNNRIKIVAEINQIEEMKAIDRPKDLRELSVIEGIQVLLQYQNPHRSNFYTIFTFNRTQPTNKYLRRKPKGFLPY